MTGPPAEPADPRVFVDTSALFALLNTSDVDHKSASDWIRGPGLRAVLGSHSYVVVESAALVARRLGPEAVRALFDAWVPELTIMYVDEALHQRGVAAYTTRMARQLSFVDSVSFEWMKHQGIRRAFAFDRDFAQEGFEVVP